MVGGGECIWFLTLPNKCSTDNDGRVLPLHLTRSGCFVKVVVGVGVKCQCIMFDVVSLLRRNKSVQYEFDWFFGDRKFINYSNALLKVICYNYKTLNVFSKKTKKKSELYRWSHSYKSIKCVMIYFFIFFCQNVIWY